MAKTPTPDAESAAPTDAEPDLAELPPPPPVDEALLNAPVTDTPPDPTFFVRNIDGEYEPANPADTAGQEVRPDYFMLGADGEYLPVQIVQVRVDDRSTALHGDERPEPEIRSDVLRFAARLLREDVQMNPSVSSYYATGLRKLATMLDQGADEQEIVERAIARREAVESEIHAEALAIAKAEGDAIHDRVIASEITLDEGKTLFAPIWAAAQQQAVANYHERERVKEEEAAAAAARAEQDAADREAQEAIRQKRLEELEAEKAALLAGAPV